MSGPPSQASAADRAFAHIRGAIMRGELAPGTMLSENHLAATLSMSRTPIRAALTRLQDEGWIHIYAQRGALVRELSPQEVVESAQLRHALETAAVRRSAAAESDWLEQKLAENLSGQGRALAGGDFDGFATLAMRFHRAFVELAGNDLMLSVYDRLQDRQRLSINQSARRISGDPQLVLREHRTLLDDAGHGDWVAFAAHLDEHQVRSHGNGHGLTVGSL